MAFYVNCRALLARADLEASRSRRYRAHSKLAIERRSRGLHRTYLASAHAHTSHTSLVLFVRPRMSLGLSQLLF